MKRRDFLRWSAALCAASANSLLPQSLHAGASAGQHRRTIPSSGETIPVVGLGTWITFGIDLEDDDAMATRERIMREFLQRGGGVLDSSPMYGNAEAVIGRCLDAIGHAKGLFAATKVWTLGDRQGFLQMEQSMSLWGLPVIDLYQVHNLLDWESHLPALYGMKQDGKIRYVGVTTSHGRRHEELQRLMQTQELDFVQFTYNILDREAEQVLLPMAQDRGIAVIINRPFQRGGLFDHVGSRPLPDFARDIECETWAQFFLKYIYSHPAVTCAIPATSRVDHLRENMNAAYGVVPDTRMRKRMQDHVARL
jgi:diketogulonate reductase-like aldo/keto reductase